MAATLDLDPLERIVARLHEAIDRFEREPANEVFRDSLIKRFELAYEVAVSAIVRYVDLYSGRMKADDSRALSGYVRTANQEGLLRGEWEQWSEFRDLRNRTVHTYKDTVADSVAAEIPAFYFEVSFLCQQLKRRINS